jgi:prepilin-type N-terminal cleavage/methylation domain-containing protein
MRRQKGFSLVELLIVVSIILIIASIAIPNLLRARIAANEAAAASSIRTINATQLMYQSAYPTVGYADSLLKLGPGSGNCRAPSQAAACLIDSSLANASSAAKAKSGYYFGIGTADNGTDGRVSQYTVAGAAASFGKTGLRDFCSTEDGVIHVQVPTGQSSPEIASEACGSWSVLQ